MLSKLIEKISNAPNPGQVHFPLDNTYACLPQRFYTQVHPTPVASPKLVIVNERLARNLGLDPDELRSPEGIRILAGNALPEKASPIAAAYAGHQFGHFVPQLGDGRAILLGEITDQDGIRRDIQLKGAGLTPFSRTADGRAALGPVLREYLTSEAMAALGIPTTRALAAITTGQQVMRETPLPGAILTRVASSHIRIGTFQYFAARHDTEGTRVLADYAIARHYPEAATAPQPYQEFLKGVITRQAKLVAQWMLVGFVHGVMNTDNIAISGETIDYGPCAFMDAYNLDTVFSSIDRNGRYAYRNQPLIMQWNLARLAEALLPLLDDTEGLALEKAQEALATFSSHFEKSYYDGFRLKLGLTINRVDDVELIEDLLTRMAENQADFTLTFRGLCDAAVTPEADATIRTLFSNPSSYDAWAVTWRQRLAEEEGIGTDRQKTMRSFNPLYIPRNNLVESALTNAVENKSFAQFHELLCVLSEPFTDQPGREHYSVRPDIESESYSTFCGT
jgi:uncharacterized protein YdiU (UPF0061 family)